MMIAVKLTTTKLKPETLKLLRLVAAKADETQYSIVDRLIKKEAQRLGLLKA